jgi:hypothetical protein
MPRHHILGEYQIEEHPSNKKVRRTSVYLTAELLAVELSAYHVIAQAEARERGCCRLQQVVDGCMGSYQHRRSRDPVLLKPAVLLDCVL